MGQTIKAPEPGLMALGELLVACFALRPQALGGADGGGEAMDEEEAMEEEEEEEEPPAAPQRQQGSSSRGRARGRGRGGGGRGGRGGGGSRGGGTTRSPVKKGGRNQRDGRTKEQVAEDRREKRRLAEAARRRGKTQGRVQEEEEEPELELQRTTTTNTAAVRRARAARASRRSCVPAPDLSGPMMMVKQLGTQMSDLIEKAASRSESAMNLLELMSPREPEQVIFGELRLARGWGSWVPANCTLLRTKPRGGEAAEWTLCAALAADKRKVAVAGGAAEASETPRKSVAQNEDVMNIFHHQLEQVKVKDKKKFEFKIKTTYDAEHDPMAKPEESLTLRARSQEEFEGWVDALTTWSQSLGAMSLLKF